MKYNIGFTLGDPGGDGHACTTDYHIVANHSADEISKAYKETTKLLGFDFIKEVGVDFQSDYWIPEKFTKELLKLGIIDEKYVRESDAEWGAPAGPQADGLDISRLRVLLPTQYDVGVDNNNFIPISYREVKEKNRISEE